MQGYNGLPLTTVPERVLADIARRHGLGSLPIRRQPWSGAMNTVHERGDELVY
jgi:hypothetical protein